MNIIFEFKNNTRIEFGGLKLYKINERTSIHTEIDACLSDPELERMYLIAKGNRLW
jgi:hypothetical protein